MLSNCGFGITSLANQSEADALASHPQSDVMASRTPRLHRASRRSLSIAWPTYRSEVNRMDGTMSELMLLYIDSFCKP